MAESNQQPSICPCGFFGSPNTAGLCSKCYKGKSEMVTCKNISIFDQLTRNDSMVIDCTAKQQREELDRIKINASTAVNTENVLKDTNDKCGVNVTVDDNSPHIRDDSAGAVAVEREERPVQKNKKRCFKCNQRLELAFIEIGRCKCEYVFCEQHRLPEQHDCVYDHKEKGRREALDKMISPKKHMGTSLRRLDSDS